VDGRDRSGGSAGQDNRVLLVERLLEREPSLGAEPSLTRKTVGDTEEITSRSSTIRTVDDLLNHIEADMTRFEIAASEGTKYSGLTADKETGKPIVTDLHRVWVRLKPRAAPNVVDALKAMLDGAAAGIRRPARKPHRVARTGGWQVIVVADVHLAKLAWTPSTGEADYDLSIATRLLGDTSKRLIANGDSLFKPARRTICYLGDLFHFDTPHGTTSSGSTYLDRDSRIQKMLDVGTDALLDIVHTSAEACQTDVVLVAGNHDEALSWAFHKILSLQFAKDRRVDVAQSYTARTYAHHGGNLLGFAHGHRAKKRLPSLMSYERPQLWAQCPYREYHTGHFHSQAAEWQKPIETIDSVLVRQAPALCPADEWHASSGFVGSRRAMESFFYRHSGGLDGMLVEGPEEKRK
jgi:hypothetical protein